VGKGENRSRKSILGGEKGWESDLGSFSPRKHSMSEKSTFFNLLVTMFQLRSVCFSSRINKFKRGRKEGRTRIQWKQTLEVFIFSLRKEKRR